jgi:hypothetical protein
MVKRTNASPARHPMSRARRSDRISPSSSFTTGFMNGVVDDDWYDGPDSTSPASAFASPRRSSISVNSATARS